MNMRTVRVAVPVVLPEVPDGDRHVEAIRHKERREGHLQGRALDRENGNRDGGQDAQPHQPVGLDLIRGRLELCVGSVPPKIERPPSDMHAYDDPHDPTPAAGPVGHRR